jgi:hypothetical protein
MAEVLEIEVWFDEEVPRVEAGLVFSIQYSVGAGRKCGATSKRKV